MFVIAVILGLGAALAVAPNNPPTDPSPADNDPYPPTDAILYYDYQQGGYLGTAPEFVIPIGTTLVSVKLIPKNTEKYAVGYFSTFLPGMPISAPLMTAIQQTNGTGYYIWPNWVGDTTPPGYDAGEEDDYWNGRRYYYEDLPWHWGDKDLDDLWVDIAWRSSGNAVEIKVVVKANKAGYPNPFEMQFDRETGDAPIRFTYTIHEPSAGPDDIGSFLLGEEPITLILFESGDEGDWGIFYGTLPLLPIVAIPVAALYAGIVLQARRRNS